MCFDELNSQRCDLNFEGCPLLGAAAEVEDGELDDRVHGAQAVELSEDPGAERRGEAHGLELALAISADTQRELGGVGVGRGAVEVGAEIVGVGDGERSRVERDDARRLDAEDPAVPPPPRVLDDEVPGEVLGLLGDGGGGSVGRRGRGGVAAGVVHVF
jgi:hypothetical protein